MGVEFLAERGMLAEDEAAIVARSHYPELAGLERAELTDLARLLRDRRARARDILYNQRRTKRGKAKGEARAAPNEPGQGPGLPDKKQVFARALKRVNARLATLSAEAKRAEAVARMRAALERVQAQHATAPSPGATASVGMVAKPRRPARPGIVQGGRVGSTSQANKRRQAKRDARA